VKQYFNIIEPAEFVKEIEAHQVLRHPCVVQLIGLCLDPLCVITEWMSRGSLYSILQDTKTPLPLSLRLKIALQIAEGMAYIHSCNLLHRDLKSLNVLVSGTWQAKIADFGQTAVASGTHTAMRGTLLWCAPEMFESTHYTQKADVYSFAVVFHEIWTRRVPFSDASEEGRRQSTMEIIRHIMSGGRPVWPTHAETVEDTAPPQWLYTLVETCWAHEPAHRLCFEQIVVILQRECEALGIELEHGSTDVESQPSASQHTSNVSSALSSLRLSLRTHNYPQPEQTSLDTPLLDVTSLVTSTPVVDTRGRVN